LAYSYTYVPYKDTGFFSRLAIDYLSNHPDTHAFYQFSPDAEGLKRAIVERAKYPVNRKALVAALNKQYTNLTRNIKTDENIQSLLNENTFTVCTAHQPNLLTGYLYFIYKILHAIKLAEQLNEEYPGKHFVPIYYMGSEDNDLEELGTFRFRDTKFTWDGNGQAGAVGRMNTKGLKPLLNELFKLFGPPGKNCEELEKLLTTAYLQHKTIAEATHYLVNELFGQYGLVVLNPDDATLKAEFIPVMEDELLHQEAYPIITGQIEKLGVNYKIQAHPRPVNLFYLSEQLRERIEKNNEKWTIVNTDKKFAKAEILDELKKNPERFSPNVMLRGLFQETILPNVAFIGGGAEVAYWLQLKTLFKHYHVFFPCIFLRQSVMWINTPQTRLREQLEFNIHEIFKPEHDLVTDYISKHTTNEWKTDEEARAIEAIFQSLAQKATSLDPTLKDGAAAALAKMKHQLQTLEKKMLRSEKKKMDIQLQRISLLKNVLFPNNSLQERVENFLDYYLDGGPAFLDVIKNGIKPLTPDFLVIE
jgi:bacillithiol biosynthesis cysteine-adding enzyme BshC